MSEWGKVVKCVLGLIAIWGVLIIFFLPVEIFIVKIWWQLCKEAWEMAL